MQRGTDSLYGHVKDYREKTTGCRKLVAGMCSARRAESSPDSDSREGIGDVVAFQL